jgi:hypothetical protein
MSTATPKTIKVKIVRAEGKYCGRVYEFDTLIKASLHLALYSNTFPREGYDKHDLFVEFSGEGNTYKGTMACMHPENERISESSNDVYNHMMGVLEHELKVSHTEEFRKEVAYFMELIKQVYNSEHAALIQTQSFSYRGLNVKRISYSVTQHAYSVSSPDGRISQIFCGDAEFNTEALCRSQNDGRVNQWSVTDAEIKHGIDALLSYGNTFGNGKIADSLMPFVTDHKGLPIPLPEHHLRALNTTY